MSRPLEERSLRRQEIADILTKAIEAHQHRKPYDIACIVRIALDQAGFRIVRKPREK